MLKSAVVLWLALLAYVAFGAGILVALAGSVLPPYLSGLNEVSPLSAGTSPGLEECTMLLQYGSVYSADLDDPVQLAALLHFHSSTGGGSWIYDEPISSAEHLQFSQLVTELEYLGYGVAEQYLNLTSLTEETDIATDMEAALIHLSQNCTLQQWLSFGQLLLKYEWGTPDVSYCQWYGITCCKTAVSKVLAKSHMYCCSAV